MIKGNKSEGSAAVARIKKFVSEHLHEPITASDLAKVAGYSQYHAARVFKAETGLAPFEFIRAIASKLMVKNLHMERERGVPWKKANFQSSSVT